MDILCSQKGKALTQRGKKISSNSLLDPTEKVNESLGLFLQMLRFLLPGGMLPVAWVQQSMRDVTGGAILVCRAQQFLTSSRCH